VTPHWHPLATVLLDEPRCFATETLVRLLLRSGDARLVYGGDRMWPALRHGTRVVVRGLSAQPVAGSVVLVPSEGVLDLLRVRWVHAGRMRLGADADPALAVDLPPDAAIAVADVRRAGVVSPTLRRIALDMAEAWHAGPDAAPTADPASSVHAKYDEQASFYARASGEVIDAALVERSSERVRPGGHVLVVGCGAGRECVGLARAGFRVTGIDFSPRMIEMARAAAARAEVAIDLVTVDVRDVRLATGAIDCAFFTYDAYSFLPGRAARVGVLRKLAASLAPGGVVLLSARRPRGGWSRAVLGLSWLARQRRGETHEWGDSHTRWVSGDGRLRRSYLRYIGEREVAREAESAGLSAGPWRGGHTLLVPRVPAV
jgi:SAM-dependent methyltransferase